MGSCRGTQDHENILERIHTQLQIHKNARAAPSGIKNPLRNPQNKKHYRDKVYLKYFTPAENNG